MIQKTVRSNDLVSPPTKIQNPKPAQANPRSHPRMPSTRKPIHHCAAPIHRSNLQRCFFYYACSIFEHHHHHRNIFMYNTMIRGYVQSHLPIPAISCCLDMLNYGFVPNNYTFSPVDQSVHDSRPKFEAQWSISSWSCSSIRVVFDKSPKRDVVVWTPMIDGLRGIPNKDAGVLNGMIAGVAKIGDGRKSLELLNKMVRDRVQPTETTF
ncbi:hypothetical protein ACFX13_017933 [Malus domestica]